MSEVQQTESISKRSKEGITKIPDGATILRKSVNTSVEEIENGFITTKSWDIKYEIKKKVKMTPELIILISAKNGTPKKILWY
jgi:hypothetical protein